MEAKMKHLEMIQSVISRMAGNSFLLKGWSVTLVSAIFALGVGDTNYLYICLAYFPCLAFWSLDGYFLRQEKMYRKLYQCVASQKGDLIDFEMRATTFKKCVDSWRVICFSTTLRLFHGTIFGVVAAITLFIFIQKE